MKQPYIHGIIDTLAGAELIRQFDIQHKNRLGVILLDTAFETACRAYLKYVAKIPISESHQQRHTLISTVKSKLSEIDSEVWQKIDWYYTEIRCDFYHQSAGKTIIEALYLDYKDIVEFVIDKALNIQSAKLVEEEIARIQSHKANGEESDEPEIEIDLHFIKDKVDRIIVAVSSTSPKNVGDINTFFKRQGISLKLSEKDFYNILARNSGSKKYFYHDKESKSWQLSKAGEKQLTKLKTE